MKSGFTREEVVDMAHTVQDTIFNRLNPPKCEHLKPLSVYSRMITCDQKTSLHYPRKLCNPFINFKIEVVNNCAEKRKLDDSSLDDGYAIPAKKASSSKALSPDVGCFMDYCSPPARQDSMSPYAISKPALFNKTQVIRSEIKEIVSSQLHFEDVECGSSTEPGCNKWTVPHHLKCEKVLLNPAPAFDCDVDDILCLNPFGTYIGEGFLDNVKSCKNPSSNTFQNKPVLIPTVAHGQELERGDGREELKKELYHNVRDVEEDKGYFSMSYIKDLKIGKDPSQSVYSQLPPAASSPLLRIGEVEVPEDECHPERSSEPGCSQQAALSGQHVSFTVSDFSPIVGGPLSVNSPVEPLESDVEEVWNIGPPMFESSICQSVTVKLNAGSEQSRQVSEEVQGGLREPIDECQDTPGDEATLDTSSETTLPLRVQVKSVVVAPSYHTSSSKPVAPLLPEQNTKPSKPIPKENRGPQCAKCGNSARRQRPVIFDREADWEREKRLYVHSVTRHMNENRGAGQDVMTELLNLMTHVAEQTPGTNGRQWQHPSDLTRRNYQRRFGNLMPTMALHEWQAKNCTTHKRFAKVPKIFERSQFP
ncbi:uncharacterized protein LOC122861864 isoform X2 [Siniperca chuatsi]|uniref:uncharacterized protein LOC122861864 isoform X2 n=1 Tax=Siniperca chuatsi TaxID=119488 RepID=UPI001CE0ED50|nr:uncharacterized protein LOC122861864 isoform X2 [Siniperca chuatsi]XP_044022804.1 uncharacterized protein LOC122861864 isoform X2 [Siniperca chuatsi]XP_044022805.1 uncharacterized protein LOC122861864 isoform X2 [Siniperca chuatsi]